MLTHGELLARIDKNWDADYDYCDVQRDKALRAVVELHRPVHNAYDTDYSWWGCLMCEEVYPCPTIQVIEKELQ